VPQQTVYHSKKYRNINEKRHLLLEILMFLALFYSVAQSVAVGLISE